MLYFQRTSFFDETPTWSFTPAPSPHSRKELPPKKTFQISTTSFHNVNIYKAYINRNCWLSLATNLVLSCGGFFQSKWGIRCILDCRHQKHISTSWTLPLKCCSSCKKISWNICIFCIAICISLSYARFSLHFVSYSLCSLRLMLTPGSIGYASRTISTERRRRRTLMVAKSTTHQCMSPTIYRPSIHSLN